MSTGPVWISTTRKQPSVSSTKHGGQMGLCKKQKKGTTLPKVFKTMKRPNQRRFLQPSRSAKTLSECTTPPSNKYLAQ